MVPTGVGLVGIDRVRIYLVESILQLLKHLPPVAVVHDPVVVPVARHSVRHEGSQDWGVAVLHPPVSSGQTGLSTGAGAPAVALRSVVSVVEVVLTAVGLAVTVGSQEGDPATEGSLLHLHLGVEVSAESLALQVWSED